MQRIERCTMQFVGILFCASMLLAQSTDGLWGYYPIHETDTQDYSGNENHMTLENLATLVQDDERGWVADFTQDSLIFDGIGGQTAPGAWLACVNNNDPAAENMAMTVCMWTKYLGFVDTWQGLIGKSAQAADKSWCIQIRQDNEFMAFHSGEGGGVETDFPVEVGEWIFWAFTYDYDFAMIYLNDDVVAEGELLPFDCENKALTAPLVIGSPEANMGCDLHFNGYIDDVRVYNRALSNDEVINVYNSTIATKVENNEFAIQGFQLGKNYPNPFNPTTTIPFSLANNTHVNLAVYNAVGQKVATLVDEIRAAGHYQVQWDGTNENGQKLGSGIYMIEMTAENFSIMHKILLLQ